uniref:Uncharacterized protein n=1 Tax=Utricularia reniformis TaxID=192314 RepID=A0A1Y0B238_9LAMI|nr:hypothetical protein AEK19_MT1205 [Utricularia reniformis]ART31419.1 hypothetical protein AEK19_MT1205 [Utricularia reniformis]
MGFSRQYILGDFPSIRIFSSEYSNRIRIQQLSTFKFHSKLMTYIRYRN